MIHSKKLTLGICLVLLIILIVGYVVNSGLKMLFYGGLKMSFFSGLRLSYI
ncbi:Uncharacterised protein [Staphylococcus aureus]|nr:hypothetical protein [Staphylococcus aureus]CXE10668.1 Uncharacterised protein [Staphylococcus aureus]